MSSCQQAREWLLDALTLSPGSCDAGPLAEHLKSCPECGKLLDELKGLEQAWRDLPIPETCAQARSRFLQRVESTQKSSPGFPRWFVAAAILVGLGLIGWFFLDGSRLYARDDIVGRLIDWNLDLADAPDEARNRLYAGTEPALAQAVQKAQLPAEDRELAQSLMESGAWLASHSDPMGEAKRLTELADKLASRLDAAARRADEREMKRFARRYRRLVQTGIQPRLEKIKKSPALDFENKRRLEKLILRDVKRQETLEQLLEKSPNATRQEIRRALDIPKKKKNDKKRAPVPPAD